MPEPKAKTDKKPTHAHVKPARKGLKVPFEASGSGVVTFVPEKGARVRLNRYWRRRIAEGAVEVEGSKKSPTAAAE